MQSGIERKGTRHGPQFSSIRETAAIVPERIIGITTCQRQPKNENGNASPGTFPAPGRWQSIRQMRSLPQRPPQCAKRET